MSVFKTKKWTALLMAPTLFATPVLAEEAAGDWAGVIAGQLHVIVHLTKAADGHYDGVLQSVDQGNVKIPIDGVTATPDSLTFTVGKVKGKYEGKWDETQKAWVGTWTQGQALPLVLKRASDADLAGPKRPQEEAISKGPLPYSSEDISFANPVASGVTLKGTFSKPEGKGPFPAVVLIAGSGPQTRDENVGGHKEFLVLSDALNRAGIAVLRYDKRGVGASSGDYKQATPGDFISDATAAFDYLKTRNDVDTKHVGLIGHSEGGLIAPAVSVNRPDTAFIVLLAGPGLRGDKILLMQQELIGRAMGATEAQIAQAKAINGTAYDIIVKSPNREAAIKDLKAQAQIGVSNKALSQAEADAAIAQLGSPWMYDFIRYDPVPTLQKVRVPVLALNGSLDLQVPPKEDLAAINTALKDNTDVTVTELPGLNHLFQTAKTGSVTEYAVIEETIAPSALKLITDWVVAHSK